MRRVEREVDGGINSVTAALGDAKTLSPFFRIPGFGRTNAIERFLEGKQLVIWSAPMSTQTIGPLYSRKRTFGKGHLFPGRPDGTCQSVHRPARSKACGWLWL
jgi:hypothetical protein